MARTDIKQKKGFSLIELLIIVAIISLLAIIFIWAFKGQLFKGKDAKRKADLHRLKIALQDWEVDHGCYPKTLQACGSDGLKPYLDVIPCDPETGDDYEYVIGIDPADLPECPTWFWLFTNLYNESDPDIEESGCQWGCGPSEAEETAYNFYVYTPNAPEPFMGDAQEGGGVPLPLGCSDNDKRWGCDGTSCFEVKLDEECHPLCHPTWSIEFMETCEANCAENPEIWTCSYE